MMGTTLANLHIRTSDSKDSYSLPTDMTAHCLTDGWVTILGESIQPGTAQKAAKKLSKAIDKPILSVEYFDDDILILEVFKRGSQVAWHVSSIDSSVRTKPGNAAVFAKELKLEDDDAKYLKYVFKCEDLQKQVLMLEDIFACPLIVDGRSLEDAGEEEFKREHDLTHARDYVATEQKANKIKNQTSVELISELGSLLDTSSHESAYLLVEPTENGRYYSERRQPFVPDEDGKLKPLWKAGQYIDDPDHIDIRYFPGKEQIAVYNDFLHCIKFYNTNADVLSAWNYAKELYPYFFIDKNAGIFESYADNRRAALIRLDSNQKIAWEFEVGYIHTMTIHKDKIYLFYTIEDYGRHIIEKSEIIQMDFNGAIQNRINFTPRGGHHWSKFLFDEFDRIYYCCTLEDETYLFCFDENLREIKKAPLVHTSFDGILDEAHKRIYLHLIDRGILAIDMETFSVIGEIKDSESMCVSCVDRDGRLVVIKGGSTLNIYDINLTLVSRHKLKGSICFHYQNISGNPCFLTFSGKGDQAFYKSDEIGTYCMVKDGMTRVFVLRG